MSGWNSGGANWEAEDSGWKDDSAGGWKGDDSGKL